MPAEAEEVDVQPDIEAALEQDGFEHEPYSIGEVHSLMAVASTFQFY